MLMDDLACVILLVGDILGDENELFMEDAIREFDRLCAKASAVLFVCERARWGMMGASWLEELWRDGPPK